MATLSLKSDASDSMVVPDDINDCRGKNILGNFIQVMIEAMPDYVLVLNRERRVLAVNNRLLKAFDIADPKGLIGMRPGEALRCVHADENPAGCGSGRHCRKCGAVLALVEAEQSHKQSSWEYRITVDGGNWHALDLEILVTPLEFEDLGLNLFAMRDISAEKRRRVLEQVFFHDVMNTAGGIRGVAETLATEKLLAPEEEGQYKKWMVTLTDKLIDEILYQRNLLAAEKGEFKPDTGMIELGVMLAELQALYAKHQLAAGRNLILGPHPTGMIVSDNGTELTSNAVSRWADEPRARAAW